MKLNRKWILVIALVLSLTMATAGTLAYLTDRDSEANVFTVGNVEIDLKEDFQQGATLFPGKDINKKPTITNVGKNDAWVWAEIAIPSALNNTTSASQNAIHFNMSAASVADGLWNWWNGGNYSEDAYLIRNEEIDGIKYDVYIVLYESVLKSGETTKEPVIYKVYLDPHVDIDPDGNWFIVDNGNVTELKWNSGTHGDPVIYVSAYAMQTEGFANVKDAYAAYNKQWGDNGTEWGEGNGPIEPPADAAIVTSATTYDDFAELLSTGRDINVTESVTIANPENSRFTEFTVNDEIELWIAEGATLTFGETTTLKGSGKLTVYSGSVFEEQELCIAGEATIVFVGGEHSFNAFSASGNGKIVVNDGVLNCNGSYAGIMGITFGENGQLIVNGGKINLYQPINLNPNRCDKAYVEINGGTVELLNGIENLFVVRNVMDKDNTSGVLRGSSIRVSGGTFIAHYEIDSAGDATSFIRNGDAPSDGNKVLVSNADGYDCAVTGGTFYGSWQRADNMRYINGNGGYSDGKFVENSIAGFVADGYQITGDATNGYIVSAK